MPASFSNQAQLSYNGITTTSNVAKGRIIETLSATKTVLTDDYNANSEKTFVISIVNSGTTDFTNLTLHDDLGAYPYSPSQTVTLTLYPLWYVGGTVKYYQNGILQTAPTVTTTGGFEISGINVPANGTAIIVYTAKVSEYAPLAAGSTITNIAKISGSGLTADIEASDIIYTDDAPYLSIIKNICPKNVTENGQLTYTFDILNYGNTAAVESDNAQITDTFSPVLNNLSVTYNGSPWSSSFYSYNAATGLFSTVAGAIRVDEAKFTQNQTTGEWTSEPGESILEISGTI